MHAASGMAQRSGIPHKGGDIIDQNQLIDTAKKLADCTQAIANQQMYVSQIATQFNQAQAMLQQMHSSLQTLLSQYHDLLVATDTSKQQAINAPVADMSTVKVQAISSTKG